MGFFEKPWNNRGHLVIKDGKDRISLIQIGDHPEDHHLEEIFIKVEDQDLADGKILGQHGEEI